MESCCPTKTAPKPSEICPNPGTPTLTQVLALACGLAVLFAPAPRKDKKGEWFESVSLLLRMSLGNTALELGNNTLPT